MRLVGQAQWGFMLEHEGMAFFVPVSRIPFPMKTEVQVNPQVTAVIQTNDRPFYIDKANKGHVLTEASEYVPMIKEVMVNYVRMNQRR